MCTGTQNANALLPFQSYLNSLVTYWYGITVKTVGKGPNSLWNSPIRLSVCLTLQGCGEDPLRAGGSGGRRDTMYNCLNSLHLLYQKPPIKGTFHAAFGQASTLCNVQCKPKSSAKAFLKSDILIHREQANQEASLGRRKGKFEDSFTTHHICAWWVPLPPQARFSLASFGVLLTGCTTLVKGITAQRCRTSFTNGTAAAFLRSLTDFNGPYAQATVPVTLTSRFMLTWQPVWCSAGRPTFKFPPAKECTGRPWASHCLPA